MNRLFFTVVLTLTSLFGLGISASAQDASGTKVVVKVNFDFVVDGSRIMPAGPCTISRVSQDPRSGIVIRSNNRSVLLLPVTIGDASADQAKLSFEHVGDKYFLSTVATPAGIYTIEIPRAVTKLAQMRDHGTVPSSGN
jgi:hypothetical protein